MGGTAGAPAFWVSWDEGVKNPAQAGFNYLFFSGAGGGGGGLGLTFLAGSGFLPPFHKLSPPELGGGLGAFLDISDPHR